MAASSSGTTITVSWKPVSCLLRNSEITGYIVRYNEVGRSCLTDVPGPETSATLDGLKGLTQYSIQVAAVGASETGLGPFSDAVTTETAAAVTTVGELTENGMHYIACLILNSFEAAAC